MTFSVTEIAITSHRDSRKRFVPAPEGGEDAKWIQHERLRAPEVTGSGLGLGRLGSSFRALSEACCLWQSVRRYAAVRR